MVKAKRIDLFTLSCLYTSYYGPTPPELDIIIHRKVRRRGAPKILGVALWFSVCIYQIYGKKCVCGGLTPVLNPLELTSNVLSYY